LTATLVILNPAAGKRLAARIWRRLRAEASQVRDWQCVMTERRGHATELARAAAASGSPRQYARVVVVGGDGTVCEAANGLAHSETPLAIIPAGTGNDVAHNLAIPDDPFAAATLAATATPRPIDLGEVQTDHSTTYFVNVAGFGFDAEAAWRANRLPHLVGGTLPYLIGTLLTLWHYASPRMRVRVDSQTVDARLFMVAVGNCASYAGGMRIVPSARPDDGALDVCVVRGLGRLELLRLIPRLYSGGHVTHPAVEVLRCRTLEAEVVGAATAAGPVRVLCHADGEQVGGLPARFAIRPGALQCVTGPAPGSAS
jgi:YegS/Rv2252/BmrU family lipid kinase